MDTTELGFLRLRHKAPDSESSQLREWPLRKEAMITAITQTTEHFRFAAAVAAFGQLLRGGTYTGTFGYEEVLTLARGARGDDPFGYRGELLLLIQLAQSLSQTKGTVTQ
jgi:Ca-activated chloride channel family protein